MNGKLVLLPPQLELMMAPISEITTEHLDQDTSNEAPATVVRPLPPEKKEKPARGKSCPKCETTQDWGMNSWCPGCGYYPTLGDKAEAVANTEGLFTSWDEVKAEKIRIPIWSVILFLGVLAIIGESLYARLMVSNQMGARMVWSLMQLGIGVFTLMCGQFIAGLLAAFKSSDFTPMDIILKPIEIWKANTARLPKIAWLFLMLGWSLTAIFGSVAIIGSIPYNALFEDWGVRDRAKPNLLQAVVSQARNAKKDEGADNLEDAMNQFVGDANAEDLEEEEKAAANENREEADCIIMGYVKLSDSYFDKIMLAAMVGQKLKFVGSINYYDLPQDVQLELSERMLHYRTKQPLVHVVDKDATWLKPNLMIRVSYEKMTESGRMVDIEFVQSLADLHP
ncbi:MAG: hypothetical protein KDA65_03165 [Planctomycetaceae bacterium]|nr:hypothetical protein [Planctomycetaceae bacterium]